MLVYRGDRAATMETNFISAPTSMAISVTFLPIGNVRRMRIMFRVIALRASDIYDPQIVAGEEPLISSNF